MKLRFIPSASIFLAAGMLGALYAAPDPNYHLYLLFGQSNMAGGGATSPVLAKECDTTARVKVMAFMNCNGQSPECKIPLGRTADKWYTAFPPLHDCSEGICPGDFFAKTLLDSVRSDITIGLIPCALSGMALNVFLPNGPNATVGPANGKNAYNWMIARCKQAQQVGVIKGILLHQGESGSGSSTAWDVMAMQIFDNIKKDLSLDENTPVVVGELRSDATSPSQNNTNFNKLVDGLPAKYKKCAVASSQGLVGNGRDVWHFTPASFQELGIRYAKAFLSVADQASVPRQGTVSISGKNLLAKPYAPGSEFPGDDLKIISLDGKILGTLKSKDGKAIPEGQMAIPLK
ncbi:MAG: sialate O-acetylesterase [Fibrobacteria bacterium]